MHCVQGGGGGGRQKLAKFCVRILWMATKAKKKKELCFSFPRASFFGRAWIFFFFT